MTTSDYDERQQHREAYTEQVQRWCMSIDHGSEERPQGLLHDQPDWAYEVMRREVREAGL